MQEMFIKKDNQMVMFGNNRIDLLSEPMEGETSLFAVLGFNENIGVASGKDWFGCE